MPWCEQSSTVRRLPCRQPGGFDRPLPMLGAISVAQAVQRRDPDLEATGIRRMSVYIP